MASFFLNTHALILIFNPVKMQFFKSLKNYISLLNESHVRSFFQR